MPNTRTKSPFIYRFYTNGSSVSYTGSTLEHALSKFQQINPFGFSQYKGKYIVRENITGYYGNCHKCEKPIWVTKKYVRENLTPLCYKCKPIK